MPWIYGLVGLLVGAILGIVISRIKTPQYKKHQHMKKELATTKFELEQQRQELTDHFSQTAELLDVLGKDYTKLYQHMANTSSELLANVPEQDQPFANKLTQTVSESEQETNIQPKDYAKGATGLLTPEKKEIIEAPEAVKASN
ncbi:Z-ring associated protein ZapG [Vibrio sp. F74]|uniref:Z-ring associated protein ZapG n=1 Tax=Vibrio sp. F74 TaxID=700020 RepID=UPI0035F57718